MVFRIWFCFHFLSPCTCGLLQNAIIVSDNTFMLHVVWIICVLHSFGDQLQVHTRRGLNPSIPRSLYICFPIMNNTTNNTCVDLSNNSISNLLMAIYIVAFVLGVVLNLITLGPIVQQVRSHNVLGVCLLNVAISDLLYIFTMPLWIHYYYSDHRWEMGQRTCQLAGFFFYSNMYISIYLLCCISVDRCLTITYPLQARAFRRPRYAWTVCGSVILIVMIIHALILALDNRNTPLDGKLRCYEHLPMPSEVARMNLIRASLGFLLPLLVLASCYWQIFGKVHRSETLDKQSKRKVQLLSMGVIVIFSVCFAPYHLLLIVRSVAMLLMQGEMYCAFEQHTYFYFSVALAISSLNSVMDPVLYVLVSNGVKEELRVYFIRGKREDPCRSQPTIETKT
ncbi:G protein-coupled receptor 184 isoform X2 [Brienomyrus brachyistius]|uniref:G protein-coupled receptor 184 isoform X2 n=1 Tax=Brienomyrus brachyistius TaxID=42636 RepID=UPI0020B37D6B|nr:G protein-coupled receptor 184 isoform X2 [Brienomyrus brachyistius]